MLVMGLHGRFATYKGREYKDSKKGDRITLYSKAEEDIKQGFIANPTGTSYVKVIESQSMDRYYTKRLMGYYIKDLYEITYVDGEEYTS